MGPHTTDEATGGEADSPRPDTHPPHCTHEAAGDGAGEPGEGAGWVLAWGGGAETSEGQARSKGNVLLTGKLCL